ncbi:MAG TPA: hypothetical protein VEX63_12185, partial [Flavisolibacter sp.]|nr:hypothetical protein [Flavisolibacter sp.]
MNRSILLMASCILAFFGLANGQKATPTQSYYSDPALSPNSQELAFVSGGDIWTAPSGGGEARLLVSHPAAESRPLYSPDGKYLAFAST